MPPSTAPGIAGGIPADRMAVTVSSTQVRGIETLSRGDRFDIIGFTPFRSRPRVGQRRSTGRRGRFVDGW